MKVSYETRENIGIIKLKSGYNALNPELVQDLDQALYHAVQDSACKAVILTGEGKFFCPGGDIKYMNSIPENIREVEIARLANMLSGTILKILDFPKPVVTAINGLVAGAGFSLALISDWRVMERDAFFYVAYLSLGFTPDGGLSWLLPRFVGIGKAQELINSRKRLSAQEAYEWGLIHRISKKEHLLNDAIEEAVRLSRFSASAIRMTRKLIWQSFGNTFERHLMVEAKTISSLAQCKDSIEFIRQIVEGKETF